VASDDDLTVDAVSDTVADEFRSVGFAEHIGNSLFGSQMELACECGKFSHFRIGQPLMVAEGYSVRSNRYISEQTGTIHDLMDLCINILCPGA